MNPISYKNKAQQEEGVANYFPITHLCAPHIFETHDGMLGSTIKVRGIPFITSTDEQLNNYQSLFHQALLKLDHNFVLYETRVRKKKSAHLKASFNNQFAAMVDEKYRQNVAQPPKKNDHLSFHDWPLAQPPPT